MGISEEKSWKSKRYYFLHKQGSKYRLQFQLAHIYRPQKYGKQSSSWWNLISERYGRVMSLSTSPSILPFLIVQCLEEKECKSVYVRFYSDIKISCSWLSSFFSSGKEKTKITCLSQIDFIDYIRFSFHTSVGILWNWDSDNFGFSELVKI